jgi:hypothetical protein
MLTELPGFHSAATRESFGINSLGNSTRLPCSSGVLWLTPVMFPPGRARLATSPDPTGSATVENTTGTVVVAPFAASAPGVAKATMTSTPSLTRSVARAGRRSWRPSALRSSKVTFWPSTYLSSASPCRSAVMSEHGPGQRMPSCRAAQR